MKIVYVLHEEGSWDYEETNSTDVYSTFEEAFKEFEQRVKYAKTDLKEWCDEDDLQFDTFIDKEKEYASFEGYEDGDFTRLHDTISVKKKEVK